MPCSAHHPFIDSFLPPEQVAIGGVGTGAAALSLPLRARDPGAGAFFFMSAMERQSRSWDHRRAPEGGGGCCSLGCWLSDVRCALLTPVPLSDAHLSEGASHGPLRQPLGSLHPGRGLAWPPNVPSRARGWAALSASQQGVRPPPGPKRFTKPLTLQTRVSKCWSQRSRAGTVPRQCR